MSNITIRFDKDKHFSAAYDNETKIGECVYELEDGNVWSIVHTEVIPGYEGQGIAKRLVTAIIDIARNTDAKIKPVCSYAVRMMDGKEEYADIIA